MSSSATTSSSVSKPIPSSNISNYSQVPSSTSFDISSRRTSSSGSFGPGSSTRHTPQARSNQPQRKQHKASRRPKLADEDAIAESAAMKSINSRKGQTSITHLMNFSLPPRHYHQSQQYGAAHRNQRRNPTWGLGSGYHAVDKARYIHANYRFIVRPEKEYSTQAVDADVHLSWDSVLQVLASAETQSTNCPICLSMPIAPRMAKCGHIFCFSCLIRYMHSTDDVDPLPEKKARWKKCPICEDTVYISESRPVRWFTSQSAKMLQEGGDVLLKLLMRETGTTLALPRDAAENYGHHEDIPWFHIAEVMDYARFMKGGGDYMISQHDQEIADLQAQEQEDELLYGDDPTWTRKAIAAIEEAKLKMKDIRNPPYTDYILAEQPQEEIPRSWEEDSSELSTNTIAAAVKQLDIDLPNSQIPAPKNTTPRISSSKISQPRFYFYHALPNFFLSPLDIRILKAAFGEFASFPSTILPRVEHISTGHVIDDDLRKRAKYMAHLPYGCEVNFLECDWTDVIGPGVLEQFREEIAKRRKRNHEKEAREERDRLRAEKEEDDKRWGALRRRRPSGLAKSFSDTDFQPLVSTELALGSSVGDSAIAMTPPWGNGRAHSSFATLVTPGTSPDGPKTVWGTTAVTPSSPPLVPIQDHIQQDDGWLQGWEKDLLDESDALAMNASSFNGEGSSRPSGNANTMRKGKKKKITLMSTNNRRGA